MAERNPIIAMRTENQGGTIAIVGVRRGKGWQSPMTSAFAVEAADNILSYRLKAADEITFADAAEIAAEQPPLSASEAGILYAAIHRAIDARNNKGVES